MDDESCSKSFRPLKDESITKKHYLLHYYHIVCQICRKESETVITRRLISIVRLYRIQKDRPLPPQRN